MVKRTAKMPVLRVLPLLPILLSIFLIYALPGQAQEPQAEEAAEVEEHPKWEGSLGLSLVMTSGNTDTQTIGVDLSTQRAPDPWGFKLEAKLIKSEQDDVVTAEKYSVNLRGKRALGERWQVFVGINGLQDKLAGYDMRAQVESGAAFHALLGPKHELTFDGGLTWSHEELVQGTDDSYLGGLLGLSYQWQLSKTAAFSERLIWHPNFDQSDDWRVVSETALKAAVNSFLALKLGYELQYENQPVPGFESTDTITRISLVVSF